MENEPLIYRLRKRAEIRRQITTRKSVQEGKPDRIADLLEEAARALEWEANANKDLKESQDHLMNFRANLRFITITILFFMSLGIMTYSLFVDGIKGWLILASGILLGLCSKVYNNFVEKSENNNVI